LNPCRQRNSRRSSKKQKKLYCAIFKERIGLEIMSKIEIYQAPNGQTSIDVTFDKETIWLTQAQIALLFNTDRTSVTKHLNKIFKSGELNENETCAKIAQVQMEGKKEIKRNILNYNLDAIISVGYRVNSIEGTQFRQWATQRLKEHLVNGYSINQKRLEQLHKTIEIIRKIYYTVFEKRPKISILGIELH
jgi:hypothetical protein